MSLQTVCGQELHGTWLMGGSKSPDKQDDLWKGAPIAAEVTAQTRAG